MKTVGSILFWSVVVLLACTLLACGKDVELRPELQAHLDEYESLITSYQAKFAAVRGNPPAAAEVSNAYSEDVRAWLSEWETVAPTLSDEEGKAVKAQIDRLNKRAVRMLKGS